MATPKQKEQLENKDTLLEQKNQMNSYIRKMRANTIVLGGDLVEVREQVGKDILDKDTKQPKIDPQTGETMKWPSKFYAKFTFMGGEVETEINENQYHSLINNIGIPYYLTGRLATVKQFGNDVIAPVFNQFELLA